MSRSRNNNVRGPTSALTEFLREAGITATTIARRTASTQQGQQEQAPAQAGPSTASQQAESSAPSRRASRTASRAANRRTSGYGSDNLDDDDEEQEPQEEDGEDGPQEELQDSPAPAKKRKLTKAAEAKLKAAEKKKMRGKGKKARTRKTRSSKPPVGNFENCARCEKQFTVTKYTMAANPPPGWLCHKRKAPRDKRDVVHYVENRLPTMVNLCIKILTQYIDDVESLGDIGSVNLEAIAKAMAKTRSLTPQNASLFYNASNSKLVFFDATNLTSLAFESLRIELLGPFLVRAPAWKLFFQAHRNLEGFLIHQSPRFDLDCVQTLISSCPGLKELRLREVGKMSDEFLNEIASLGPNSLAYLDLGFLDEGLAGHTGNLEFLGISHLPELTDKDVTAFFSEWENTPLVGLDASRNSDLAGESLTAIMKHSGLTLETLNINGWKDGIGRKGKELRQLDVGFCRNINDFVVKDWGRAKGGCKNLKELKVWGCNRVTSACPRKPGLALHGVESHVIKTR
ncbi:hypothetical protein FA13DRAFT_1747165 [Coprinellus micaceus]|uniref:DNA repair protein rhp7 treble clef domain-containing protein n=1 Tax=Coprinellus micaceus TaxID=71717 RepID=A0A4Y7S4Z3_COPMI|nr:hypothetical protein FA13DRAFT_1747165 [Coprinellus micaceus]